MYKKSTVYLGIDPGNKGAFCLLNAQGKIIKCWEMPRIGSKFDSHGIGELFRNFDKLSKENNVEIKCGLEKTFAYSEDYKSDDRMKKIEGIVSMHNYGIGFGCLLGTVNYLGWKHHVISPHTWQAELWHGADCHKKSKEKSLEVFNRIWPDEIHKVQLGERTDRPHDGAIDAALIAEYVRRIEK